MTYPTIHLNGTHPRTLLADQCEAMNALRAAISIAGGWPQWPGLHLRALRPSLLPWRSTGTHPGLAQRLSEAGGHGLWSKHVR
jgi:hypothetical protein